MVSRWGTPREAGTRSTPPAGAERCGGSPEPQGPGQLLGRSLSALGLSFPSSEMEGGGLLVSSRCGVAPPPLSRTFLLAEVRPPGERRDAGGQPSPRPEGRAEEGFQGPGTSEPETACLTLPQPHKGFPLPYPPLPQPGREMPLSDRIQTKEWDGCASSHRSLGTVMLLWGMGRT